VYRPERIFAYPAVSPKLFSLHLNYVRRMWADGASVESVAYHFVGVVVK